MYCDIIIQQHEIPLSDVHQCHRHQRIIPQDNARSHVTCFCHRILELMISYFTRSFVDQHHLGCNETPIIRRLPNVPLTLMQLDIALTIPQKFLVTFVRSMIVSYALILVEETLVIKYLF